MGTDLDHAPIDLGVLSYDSQKMRLPESEWVTRAAKVADFLLRWSALDAQEQEREIQAFAHRAGVGVEEVRAKLNDMLDGICDGPGTCV